MQIWCAENEERDMSDMLLSRRSKDHSMLNHSLFRKHYGKVRDTLHKLHTGLSQKMDRLEREYFRNNGKLADQCLDSILHRKIRVIQYYMKV